MGLKICKRCGYEGKGSSGPGRKLTTFKVLGFLLMLPIYSIVKIFTSSGGGKYCPHCQTATMVKLSSDEGWVTQRKFEVRDGLVPAQAEVKKETDSFGTVQVAARVEKTVDPDQW